MDLQAVYLASAGVLIIIIAFKYIAELYLVHAAKTPPPKGCRKLGISSKSNIADELASKYRSSPVTNGDAKLLPRIKALFIYPIKGCQPVELSSSAITPTGLAYDRQFTFAQLKSPFPVSLTATEAEKSAHRWEMINQKQFARMALIKTEVWVPDRETKGYDEQSQEVASGGAIRLSFPYEREEGLAGFLQRLKNVLHLPKPYMTVTIPLAPTPEYVKAQAFSEEEVFIWGDTPKALNLSCILPPELKYFIGVRNPMALFRILPGAERHLTKSVPAPEDTEAGVAITAFADMHPIHLLGLSSVHDIASRVSTSIKKFSSLRFRSNILLSQSAPFEEDTWTLIKINQQDFHVACRTPRCTVPNIDPRSGVRHTVEPNKTLRAYRAVDEGAGDLACVGMQLVPRNKTGVISVGDAVYVITTGDHYFGK